MAKTDELVKVKALVYLKYNTEYFDVGQEFGVNKNDLEEMGESGLIGPGESASNETEETPNKLGEVLIPKEGE